MFHFEPAYAWDTETKTLLHMDGSDEGTTFTDEIGKTYTAYGHANTEVDQKVFGTASGQFDGNGDDYISTPNHADFDLGADDFTVDFRCMSTSWVGSFYPTIAMYGTLASRGWAVNVCSDRIRLYYTTNGSADQSVDIMTTNNINTWYHIEIGVTGGKLYCFKDGTLLNAGGTAFSPHIYAANQPFVIGRFGDYTEGNHSWKGYIDEFRLDHGICRHTSDFTPPASAYTDETNQPTVSTTAATSVSYTTATLNGNLTDLGAAASVDVSFEYGETVSYGSTASADESPMAGTGVFHKDVVGLNAGTTYHYRAKADGDGDPVYGGDQQFTTLTQAPTASTTAASSISMNKEGTTSGNFTGNLSNLGDDTGATLSFQYGLSTSYGSETAGVAYNFTGAYGDAIPSNLLPGNLYHYRIKAVNTYGTSYGSDGNFTLTMPTMDTLSATYTSPGDTTATLSGNITAMGVASNVTTYFQWGNSLAYGTNTTDQAFTTTSSYNATASGFLHNQAIHYRAVAEIGSNYSYGDDVSFFIAPGALAEVLWYQPINIIENTGSDINFGTYGPVSYNGMVWSSSAATFMANSDLDWIWAQPTYPYSGDMGAMGNILKGAGKKVILRTWFGDDPDIVAGGYTDWSLLNAGGATAIEMAVNATEAQIENIGPENLYAITIQEEDPDTFGGSIADYTAAYNAMYTSLKTDYPSLKIFATPLFGSLTNSEIEALSMDGIFCYTYASNLANVDAMLTRGMTVATDKGVLSEIYTLIHGTTTISESWDPNSHVNYIQDVYDIAIADNYTNIGFYSFNTYNPAGSLENILFNSYVDDGSAEWRNNYDHKAMMESIIDGAATGGILPDRDTSDGAQDGLISWGTNPSGVSVVVSTFGTGLSGGKEAKAPAYSLIATGNFITTPPAPAGNFSTVVTPSDPFTPIITAVANVGNTPVQLPLMIISGFIILITSLTSSWFMRRFGSTTHFVKMVIIFGLMCIWTGVKIYDVWMVIIFVILALAISWMSQQRGTT